VLDYTQTSTPQPPIQTELAKIHTGSKKACITSTEKASHQLKSITLIKKACITSIGKGVFWVNR
jgi:hypothetical protein